MSNASRTLVTGFHRSLLDRRTFLIGASSALTGCAATTSSPAIEPVAYAPVAQALVADPHYAAMYAAMPDERFPIPAIDFTKVDPQYLRQIAPYARPEQPGTLVVDPHAKFLYLVMEGGKAMRYGVGAGREGFEWSGRGVIQYKRAWPRWTPPDKMVARQPELEPYSIANGGMDPGIDNPLGARALYIFENGQDTLYRLHGTKEPWSIGRAASSGCIRLFNQDIIDLYNRTPNGTPVVVLDAGPPELAV